MKAEKITERKMKLEAYLDDLKEMMELAEDESEREKLEAVADQIKDELAFLENL